MDRSRATVHGLTNSLTQLSMHTCHGCSSVIDHWASRVKSQLKIIQGGFLKGTVKV